MYKQHFILCCSIYSPVVQNYMRDYKFAGGAKFRPVIDLLLKSFIYLHTDMHLCMLKKREQ